VTTETIGAIYSARDLVGDDVLPISLWSANTNRYVDSNIFVKVAAGGDVPAVKATVEKISTAYGRPTVDDHAEFVATAAQAINFVLGIVYVLLAPARGGCVCDRRHCCVGRKSDTTVARREACRVCEPNETADNGQHESPI
jgi:hypothetical protein